MGYTARFERGSYYIDLSSGDYTLFQDFMPPVTGLSHILGGSSRNVSGLSVIGEAHNDRQMNFTVKCNGSTQTETHYLADRLSAFINNLSKTEKTYLAYKPASATSYEPVWGQRGAMVRYEVKNASAQIVEPYGRGNINAQVVKVYISLTVAPYGYGKRQRLATGTGSITPYRAGASDTVTRGLVIEQAGTNKMTNPVFGHATWNNGWTAGGSLSATKNTDKAYIWEGAASAKLVRKAAVSWTFTQSIDVGNTNTHTLSAYVKKKDSSAVTSTDIGIYYGTGQTTTFVSLGNGWYLIHASFSGVAAATAAGVIPNVIGQEIYIGGVQLEEKAYPTPLIYGDQLDCSWSGTAHASTSTRTAAQVKVPTTDILNLGGGTIRVVWQPRVANTSLRYTDTSWYLFDDSGGTNFRAGWRHTTGVWFFNDGTNEATSAGSQTFSAGAAIVFHMVWSKDGLALYKNGTVLDTDSTYTPPTFGASLCIGHSTAPSNHIGGIFQGFTIFDKPMSSTEVLADYNEISPLASGNMRVDWMPTLWTDDGDDTVDNYFDATHEHWFTALDIPGDVPAMTEIKGVVGGGAGDKDFYISLFDTREYVKPTNLYFTESPKVTSIGSSSYAAITSTQTISYKLMSEINNRTWYGVAYFTDAGSEDLLIYNLFDSIQTDVSSANDSVIWSVSNGWHFSRPYNENYSLLADISTALYAKRTTGSAANVTLTYYTLVPDPLLFVSVPWNYLTTNFVYTSEFMTVDVDYSSFGASGTTTLKARGARVELVPEKYNSLICFISGNTTYTMQFSSVFVAPRWGLL